MKNDKILNFLIAFFITLILVNLFFPKQNTTVVDSGIKFESTSKSYTIPNVPVLNITNYDNKEVTINTCKNLTITKDGNKVENINSNKDFCKDITLIQNKKELLDLKPISKLFTLTGDYVFELSIGDKKYTSIVTESEKGFFNNFFSNIFYGPVYNLFVFLIKVLPSHSLGLSIIIVTIIIRLIVLVPQHKVMVNGRKMQAIQPKIKEIQTKYKGDQAKMGMELLELYKKEKVNPMGSCLPLMLQLPLLMVLYWIVSSITSPENYYYLYSFLSDFQVSLINPHFFGLNLIKQEMISALILALLIGVFQWIQIKMSLTFSQKKKDHGKIVEKEVTVDDPISDFMPDPDFMNKFMLWGMSGMLAFSSYFFPSGVSIYWLIGTIFTIIQQYVANKIADKNKSNPDIEIISNKKTKRV